MRGVWLALLMILPQLHAYSDADWDGVEDRFDRCPQTPLSDLVNLEGCTTLKTQSALHYSLISGIGYSQVNYASQEKADTTNISLEANIYYNNWQLQGVISRYSSDTGTTNETGMEDSVLNLLYQWPLSEQMTITPGIGIIFPTYKSGYENESTDYSAMLSVEYQFSPTIYGFGGYTYTWVNDTDTPIVKYQNNNSFYAGLGYVAKSGQEWNCHYNSNKTIYRDSESSRSIGIGFFRQLTPHWFLDGNYDYGLSDSAGDHSVNVRLGYYF